MPRAVSNTSPLVYLHQLGHLELLRLLYGTPLVPPAVLDELSVGVRVGAAVPAPEQLDGFEVRAPADEALARVSARLHRGEREAVALALQLGEAFVVVDDRAARQVAATLGVRIVGTVGMLVLAKHAGHVPLVAPLLDAIVARGFRLDEAVRRRALNLAGE